MALHVSKANSCKTVEIRTLDHCELSNRSDWMWAYMDQRVDFRDDLNQLDARRLPRGIRSTSEGLDQIEDRQGIVFLRRRLSGWR